MTNFNKVIEEDSIPKVSSDGEPHEILTLVAVSSGAITAIIILVILGFLIDCNKNKKCNNNNRTNLNKNMSRRFKLFSHRQSLDITKNDSIQTISSSISSSDITTKSYFVNEKIYLSNSKNYKKKDDLDLESTYIPGVTTIAL